MDISQPTLRTLSILANPSDLPRFDEESLWKQMRETLTPFQTRGAIQYERLQPASSIALRNKLDAGPWNLLHFIVHGQERAAVRYGTLALQSGDGRAGKITGQALAAQLASSCPALALVVIQAAADGPLCYSIVAEEIIAHGIPAVLMVPRLPEQLQSLFIARLYSGLLLGQNASQLAAYIIAANPAAFGLVRISSGDPHKPLFAIQAPGGDLKSAAPDASKASPASASPDGSPAAWEAIIRRKRQAGVFDVFLCHNSADKPMVLQIGQQLKEAGILPWIDVEDLPPGVPWHSLLEWQIEHCRSAAICLGAAGMGPWQEREMYGFLSAFVKRGSPVIPLLLPDAPSKVSLPVFLSQMTRVDFRSPDSKPLMRLIWGITGERPDF